MNTQPDIGKRAICLTDMKLFGTITSVVVDPHDRCWDHIRVNGQDGGPHRHYWAIEGDEGISGELFEKHKKVFA